MRPRLALLLALVALGCRPSESGSRPDEPLIDAPDSDEGGEGGEHNEADPAPEDPPRPEGAIFRSELLRATQGGSPAYLMSQLGPEPYRPQGRFEGWVITRVWPADPELCAPGCDLELGDIILSVNGSQLETPEELSNMLARLEEIEEIEVRGIRGGEFFEHAHPVLDSLPAGR